MTSPMPPEHARKAIDAAEGTTDYTWVDAHHALETIAGMSEEYTQEILLKGEWHPIYEDLWYDNPKECEDLWMAIERWRYHDEPIRIVRRYVTQHEVIDGD